MFDFLTFAVMLWAFDSGPAQFRSGWFVESLATQSLVIFAIRTRYVPFFRSHPSLPLTLAALVVGYLILVEVGKRWFYRPAAAPAAGIPTDLGHRFLRRRAARFSVAAPLVAPRAPTSAPTRRP